MFQLVVQERELFDEVTNKRFRTKGTVLQLEHSLVSLSKWESKWKVPFIGNDHMTQEMSIDYIRTMTITQNVDPTVYDYLTPENLKEVRDYIDDPMTATTFRNQPGKGSSRQVITSEVIYCWMVLLQIPFDPCQKWHLNRLLTLIRVCDEKSSPKKKMSRRDAMNQQRSLNAARKAKHHTHG